MAPSPLALAGTNPPIADHIVPEDFLSGIGANRISHCGLPEPGWAHRHTFYMIVYITRGSGTHVVDSRNYPMRPGTLFFIRPDQVHLWDYAAVPAGYAVSVAEDLLSANSQAAGVARDAELFDHLIDAGPLRLTAAQARVIRPAFEEMAAEYEAGRCDYSSVMHAYLHVLLARCHRLLQERGGEQPNPYPARPLVRRFTDLVMHSGGRKQRVRDYSDCLGITPSHLAEAVREVTGRTPGQIIRAAQIAEARRLLRYTDKTIAQVADELGFNDAAYFGRFFKRETGLRPGEFRRRARTLALAPEGDVDATLPLTAQVG